MWQVSELARTISFSLNPASIDRAIHELEQYRTWFNERCVELRRRVAERIAWSAEEGFRTASAGDIIGMVVGGRVVSAPQALSDVTVTVSEGRDVSIVIANGDQAVFIEYGAGVYHNGAPGDSPHPWGIQQGFGIGTYGQGKGVRNVWGYEDENGNIILTHGTPAAMPMYRGAEEAIRVLSDIVREVFG